MKHLFVARHGNYGNDDKLDNLGRKQMETLGKTIKGILNGGSAHIISSTAQRALDSSQILAIQLVSPPEFEQIPYLRSGSDAPKGSYEWESNNDMVIDIINERREKAEGLVIVTHLEVAESFPTHFLRKEFNEKGRLDGIAKGMAVHFDLEGRAYQYIPKRR